MEYLKNKKILRIVCSFVVYVVIFIYLQSNSQITTFDSGNFENVKSAIEKINGENPTLGIKTKNTDCHVRGPLPDPHCSPGAIFEKAKLDEICVSGYTKTVRNVSVSLKKKIYKAYGISYPQPFGTYEMDHLIPLSIGGSNDPANLFPESVKSSDQSDIGFKQKDVVENYLHREVCNGHIDIRAAQTAIARDWLEIYKNISPEDIKSLEAEFKSWTDRDLTN